jgi:signal transduction histidine kinase
MAPVADITRLAASVDADDLDTRLNLDLPNDELGRLAATFDVMLGRIGASFERQRRFTGDAAHELRTPLSLMRSRIELAQMESPPDDPHAEVFEDLQNDLDRLTGLVGSLLTLARADSRELALDRGPLDLAALIETTVETFQPRFAETGVTSRLATIPCTLVADADLLVQVLVNLIANALAHTPRGGTIETGCRCTGSEALFWVADTGTGIAPEHQPRVFDRFYRVDPGRTRAAGGAGLGLSISRAIVEAHAGRISLQSDPGHGTRIEVALPVSSPPPVIPSLSRNLPER